MVWLKLLNLNWGKRSNSVEITTIQKKSEIVLLKLLSAILCKVKSRTIFFAPEQLFWYHGTDTIFWHYIHPCSQAELSIQLKTQLNWDQNCIFAEWNELDVKSAMFDMAEFWVSDFESISLFTFYSKLEYHEKHNSCFKKYWFSYALSICLDKIFFVLDKTEIVQDKILVHG